MKQEKKVTLRLDNAFYAYDQRLIFSDISLSLYQGSLTVIIGKSGSGKSTLFHLLTLLQEWQKGSFFMEPYGFIQHIPEKKRSDIRQKSIGILHQNCYLFQELNLRENISLPLWLQNEKNTIVQQKTDFWLKEMDLLHREMATIQSLSGGERQRVAFAQCCIKDPLFLFADEPTGSLDPKRADLFWKFFSHQANLGKTVCIVTHDQERAHQYADQILDVHEGKISVLKTNLD